jgi:hypoxanthine phosphoribosyltransferase
MSPLSKLEKPSLHLPHSCNKALPLSKHGDLMISNLQPLISLEDLTTTVQRLAQELDDAYAQRPLTLVGILTGAFVFLADLIRHMRRPLECVTFIRMASYGSSTVSSGHVEVVMGLAADLITHKDIVVVEDIVDTGLTTHAALQYLQRSHPASLALCALLDKPARRQVPVHIDYLGFTVPDLFVVGYGIDFAQHYRQLPTIYTLEATTGAHPGQP